jgi:hypothetical protein
MTTPLFTLGALVATPGALSVAEECTNPQSAMRAILFLHHHGLWNATLMCEEDREYNNAAIENGGRILSVWELDVPDSPHPTPVWIITEADRSVTTLLLPSEY